MNYRENIDPRGLKEVNDAVGPFEQFSHIVASNFRNYPARLRKDSGLVRLRENAIDQALSVDR